MHFFKHMLLEVKAQLDDNNRYVLNPVMNDCQQNEDLIGRLCKSSKKIDLRVMTKRVLEFYLVKAHILLKRFEQHWVPSGDKTKVMAAAVVGKGGGADHLNPFLYE